MYVKTSVHAERQNSPWKSVTTTLYDDRDREEIFDLQEGESQYEQKEEVMTGIPVFGKWEHWIHTLFLTKLV